MQFPTSLLGLAALISLIVASPVEKRASTGMFLCTDKNFSGYCVHIVQPQGSCVNLASDLSDLVTSIGPDANALNCRMYFDLNCIDTNGYRHFDASYPGFSDLSSTNPAANDQVSSYKCGV